MKIYYYNLCVRGFRLSALRALFLAIVLLVGTAYSNPKSESEVKALWLVNVARFIEWPPSQDSRIDSLRVVVIGDPDIFSQLKKYNGKSVNGRNIDVKYFRKFNSQETLRKSDIVFVADQAKLSSPDVLNFIEGHGVFAVGENSSFVDEGGVMGLLIVDGSIRYELNRDRARKEKIGISSELLGRASRIVDNSKKPREGS